jgi:hypothetical protein
LLTWLGLGAPIRCNAADSMLGTEQHHPLLGLEHQQVELLCLTACLLGN